MKFFVILCFVCLQVFLFTYFSLSGERDRALNALRECNSKKEELKNHILKYDPKFKLNNSK